MGAWIRRLGAAAIVVYTALFAWTGRHVGRADAAYRDGRFDEAHAILTRAAFWHVRSGRVNDALGVVDLARGRLDEAGTHLLAARGGFFHPPAFGEESVLLSFLREGKIEAARTYAAHRLTIASTPATAFYLGAAENGLNRLDDSEKHLGEATGESSLKERIDAQRAIIAAKRKTGRADYLFDARGAPLAGLDMTTGHPALLVPELGPLLSGPYAIHLDPRDNTGHVRLSLDLEMQRAAQAALGARSGSLVVVDVATGGLLAAASQPASWLSPDGAALPALTRTYEPGSIIKMITLTAALRKGLDVEGLFPLDCPGWIAIDGVAFRDWMPHRRVESIDQAVAVSCNIAFGRIGGEVGRDALDAELRRFGFDFRSERGAGATDFRLLTGALLTEDGAH
ncbi:MAG TPA: penicillin-binding transpeptidase domain-containing protein, partial [Patescibacteria group bacterium]|nr:penicillin-binding transpeptidase domain-containing protein [Patescibacteria group bacterium]